MRVQLLLDGICTDRLLRLKAEYEATASAWARDLARLESLTVAARERGQQLSDAHFAEMGHAREEWNFATRQVRRIEERLSK